MDRKAVLFVAGIAVGSLCGLIAGSFVASKLGHEVRKVSDNVSEKFFHHEKTPRFELLLQ
jgi:hypothetical protein